MFWLLPETVAFILQNSIHVLSQNSDCSIIPVSFDQSWINFNPSCYSLLVPVNDVDTTRRDEKNQKSSRSDFSFFFLYVPSPSRAWWWQRRIRYQQAELRRKEEVQTTWTFSRILSLTAGREWDEDGIRANESLMTVIFQTLDQHKSWKITISTWCSDYCFKLC